MSSPTPKDPPPSGTGPAPRRPLGQILVDGEFISPTDLERALQQQKATGELLGQVLVGLGQLSEAELRAALAIQEDLSSLDRALKLAAGSRLRLGELLVASHRITKEQLERALEEQLTDGAAEPSKLRLGEILIAAGLLTHEQLELALERQRKSEKSLSEILVEAGILEPDKVELGLRIQRRLVAAALTATLTLAVADMAQAESGTARQSASTTVSANVVPYTSLEVRAAAGELVITQEDIARGYVEVPAAARLALRSNDPTGYRLQFDIDADFITGAEVRGLERTVRLGARGGRIDLPPAATTRAQLDLGFRFELAETARPGHYSWPVRVSGSSRPI